MKFAFVVDPLNELKIYKDSTYAMMREAQARDHELHVLMQEDLFLDKSVVLGNARRIHLTDDQTGWYRTEPARVTALTEYDAVLMRKDPPFDMEYVYSTYLLEIARSGGALIVNDPMAIRNCNEKIMATGFQEFIPPARVTRRCDLLREFLSVHEDIIVKPLDGMGGTSVFRIRQGDPNTNVILEAVTRNGERSVMAQRFIPEIVNGDKRILLIRGRAVPYALARIPKPGETRGNLAAGGSGIARPLTQRDREIARALGPQLYARGFLLAGIDVIGDYLTEINVTSPTCFQEITMQTGFNVAGMMLDALEAEARMFASTQSNPLPVRKQARRPYAVSA